MDKCLHIGLSHLKIRHDAFSFSVKWSHGAPYEAIDVGSENFILLGPTPS